jgi:hypothetical protein
MKKRTPYKERGIISTLNCGIFDAKILFSVNYTYDELVAVLKKQRCFDWLKGIEDDKAHFEDENCHRFASLRIVKGVHFYYIIFTSPFKWDDKDYCSLAHEVLHICQFILPQYLGDVMREMECFAYTHTHIMQQCLKELRKIKT